MQQFFDDTLDNLLIEKPETIAIAFSGGADSFALLHLAHIWAQKNDIALHALTVDHRLRADSTSEAEKMGAWCKENNIDHTILPWLDDKPCTGIQDAARNARRSLLFTACFEKNIPVLLMGHQADDQAETFLMRLQRGSGLLGMTGIQPCTYDHATNVSLIRPLLTIRRQALRDYAVAHDLPFVDDPSNDNPSFERAAIRQVLQQLPDLADGVVKTVERLTRVDVALMATADECFLRHREITDKGVWLPCSLFDAFEDEICQRVVEQAIYLIDADADIPLAGLENLILKLRQEDFAGQSLAGCMIGPKLWQKQKGYLIEPAPPRRA